jgi:hypothetical protein
MTVQIELSSRHWWLFALRGVVLVAAPGAGALAVVWLIGTYAVIAGILLIALAVRLYGSSRRRHAVGIAR